MGAGLGGAPLFAAAAAVSVATIVLSLFLNAPSELLELATQSWRAKGRRKAEGNSMINQCLGLPEGSDPIGAVEDYFLR